MILHLRFNGHWVFAGVYETAAHYYALHLVRHLEATVVWVVELYGVVSLTRRSCRELEFEIRAKHARLRPHVMASAALRDCHLHQVSRPFHLPKTTGAMATGSQHNTRAVVPQLTYATWTTV